MLSPLLLLLPVHFVQPTVFDTLVARTEGTYVYLPSRLEDGTRHDPAITLGGTDVQTTEASPPSSSPSSPPSSPLKLGLSAELVQRGGALVGGSLDALVEHLLPNESYYPEVYWHNAIDLFGAFSSSIAFNPQRARLCLLLSCAAGCS